MTSILSGGFARCTKTLRLRVGDGRCARIYAPAFHHVDVPTLAIASATRPLDSFEPDFPRVPHHAGVHGLPINTRVLHGSSPILRAVRCQRAPEPRLLRFPFATHTLLRFALAMRSIRHVSRHPESAMQCCTQKLRARNTHFYGSECAVAGRRLTVRAAGVPPVTRTASATMPTTSSCRNDERSR